ncbi:MAG: hypothetical protein HY332_14635 [Chloroflexi bacterium]|nr:hypothetical protein [Chloroflexota bacterium]
MSSFDLFGQPITAHTALSLALDDDGALVPRLRDRTWRKFVSAPSPEVVRELYAPALSAARTYDRECAYFSSSVLAAAAAGFEPFLRRLAAPDYRGPRPAMRLIVNEQLQPADAQALLSQGDPAPLARHLLARLGEPATGAEAARLAALAWLARAGLLEVKVGVLRQGAGIVHAKFGLVTDAQGDVLVFRGSANESASGLAGNYEEIEVSPAWLSDADAQAVNYYRTRFDQLWQDQHRYVRTVTLPDAARQGLLRFAPAKPPFFPPPAPPINTPPPTEAAPPQTPKGVREAPLATTLDTRKARASWRFLLAAPYLPDGDLAAVALAPVDPWPHQQRVIRDVVAAWPDGRLLCDEVGMGKTIEAALAVQALLAGRGVARALLLVPAGLLRQWQAELREKAGVLAPRWEDGRLTWPGEVVDVAAQTVTDALAQPLLLLSRELARTEAMKARLDAAEPWDLVLIDEAHHARRTEKDARAFNQANLLLRLARDLHLRGQARSLLLLSATPMQTSPWEPWDLLVPLGVGGEWQAGFDTVERYFRCIGALEWGQRPPDDALPAAAQRLAVSVAGKPPDGLPSLATGGGLPVHRPRWARWLRQSTPLARRMHRHTRSLLRQYHARGIVELPPPRRDVQEEVVEFAYRPERECYEAVSRYIDARYVLLEKEKRGKGFVMVVYQRRATSSWGALKESMLRREEALLRHRESLLTKSYDPAVAAIVHVGVAVSADDLADAGEEAEIDAALPSTVAGVDAEVREVRRLLDRIRLLAGSDSKADRLWDVLHRVTEGGRPVLVFSEYGDTVRSLRDRLVSTWGQRLAVYTGDGGERWNGTAWQTVKKGAITAALEGGEIHVLLCTDAASEGLNLQRAGALVNYDLPWNPARVEQRIGRIDRIGQRHAVLPIRNFFLAGSIDRNVYHVLNVRCGLFESFVGPMQPVLSAARRLLMRRVPLQQLDAEIANLEQTAAAAERNMVAQSVYTPSDAAALEDLNVPGALPPVEKEQLKAALARLVEADVGVSAEALDDGAWQIRTPANATTVGLDSAVLEAREDAEPFGPGSRMWLQIEALLRELPAGSPLVIARAAQAAQGTSAPPALGAESNARAGSGAYNANGAAAAPARYGAFDGSPAFVAVEMRWVSADGQSRPVSAMADLLALLDAWEGQSPPQQALETARRQAQDAAEARVRQMADAALARQRDALQSQHAACSLRLRRAAARALEAAQPGQPWTATWQAQLARRDVSERWQEAFRCLGSQFPAWTAEETVFVRAEVGRLTPAKREGLRGLSELIAALDDPRWAVEETLASLAVLAALPSAE